MNVAAAAVRAVERPIMRAREKLLALMPLTERRVHLAGISTALLSGGSGQPIVLLHGPGEHAAKWFRIAPDLMRSCTVIAPDLPGHGASERGDRPLDTEQVLDWLDALIRETCGEPPVLVGQILGGAIAARYAARHAERISRLVLSDTLGLVPFNPAPEFAHALQCFLSEPGAKTHDGLWQYCAHDLERLRQALGEQWSLLKDYNLDRASADELKPVQLALMQQFAFEAIDPDLLKCISTPTTLIWGRHDLATPLSVAARASQRYHWPLHVIDDCGDDPPIEQPQAFLRALGATS